MESMPGSTPDYKSQKPVSIEKRTAGYMRDLRAGKKHPKRGGDFSNRPPVDREAKEVGRAAAGYLEELVSQRIDELENARRRHLMETVPAVQRAISQRNGDEEEALKEKAAREIDSLIARVADGINEKAVQKAADRLRMVRDHITRDIN